MDDWLSNLTELRANYEEEVAELRADESLRQKAKNERIRDLTRAFTSAYAAERARIEEALEQEYRRLYLAAHASEEEDGADVQRQLLGELRRQRVERGLLDVWEQRGAGPTLEEYEEASQRGDAVELAAYERLGPRRIKDAWQRQAFAERAEAGRLERMAPEQRRAIEELESFEKERQELGYALALRGSTAKAMSSGNLQGTRDTEDGRNRRRIRG